MKRTALVAGATGLVGSEVCRLLAESGRPVRALVTDVARGTGAPDHHPALLAILAAAGEPSSRP